ncbi:UDP-N-acetylmuramoyl-L-alanyl-D-glutamate--2,6-diaminopimelate ligase [Romboutsia weinsteinii]|uniref:UDP-N-acetylmuramoyl-L-alanyl-D-glutamate--2,6-diaminopimelate ligase n=1 Tax=Romboutsia weinsteinii TaxID=2020949 RepID=A0A371J715_9FIRM|nr:UDP-N-acetylmuramoyl-L-alanyl-D-glutamate--2,6-diaminopimelate ligase [Romboutsia weinsteinii]RDY28562.1 UDP-N-acetylmuramoyl-L-alanyl-D-glutamate--2,6-diaminopimelate ligase [Romboutsia weinsteinii]
MNLKDVIQGINVLDINGELNIDIDNIQYDSRKVTEGTLFICIKGFTSDGHKYIQSAIEKGAKAFLVQEDINIEGYTFVKVEDTRKTMAKVADNFYNHPSKKFEVIGVTGTNGKTSITTFLNEILSSDYKKVGLIGTIKIFDGEKEVESNATTPESIDLQECFNTMVNNGCDYCAMEVSSHSLVLNRVDETEFKIGLFTNLTPDHLDFHKDLDDYRDAKEILFHKTTVANIINIDDNGGKQIYENIKNLKTPAYTYGIDNNADFMAKDIKIDAKGVSYRLITPTYEEDMFVPVPGKFTVYNTLAVIAACYMLNIPKEVVINGLGKTNGVAGRFETVPNDKEISVIVDYAHTPDALENILNTAKEFAKGKIITVFGCGGDRDTTKRPLMGDIAQKLSDTCIVTSDNPRTEDPVVIIDDILNGLDRDNKNYEVIIDRKEAIGHAISMANKNDVILIAGKGHENYQIIGKTKHHFDDKEIANEFLRNK